MSNRGAFTASYHVDCVDMDDFFMRAAEELIEELGREPTASEIEERAQDLYEDKASRAYDAYKDRMKYGDD